MRTLIAAGAVLLGMALVGSSFLVGYMAGRPSAIYAVVPAGKNVKANWESGFFIDTGAWKELCYKHLTGQGPWQRGKIVAVGLEIAEHGEANPRNQIAVIRCER